MTIWILSLLLLASLAALGYRQGAIRVAFSFAGIVFGALLAVPLGRLLKPLLAAVGVHNPVLLWAAPPFIVFILILAAFKISALPLHKKIDVRLKYETSDLRYALWERLMRRLGLCLGLVNATAYLALLCFIIYASSYWTVQIATSDDDPVGLRLLNRAGRDLESTGLTKVAGAIDRMPAAYHDAADVAGMLYQTPLLEARLSRYPAFLGLAERPEIRAMAEDAALTNLRFRHAPLKELVKHPTVNTVVNNPDLLRTIWAAVEPNLRDLSVFLKDGTSAKYGGQPLLGRWSFDLPWAILQASKAKPGITSSEMRNLRTLTAATFAQIKLVVTPENQAFLKNVPSLLTAPDATASAAAPARQNLAGQWKASDGHYLLSFNTGNSVDEFSAELQAGRLIVTGRGVTLSFARED